MPVWKLTPTDLNAIQWQVSKYDGEVVIRADSEERARELVGYCCWKSGQSSDANIAGPPWNNPNLVAVTQCNDAAFNSSDAGEEVLSPPEVVEWWKEFND
jgi:hypothetical protein